jgi:hypothetical protein
MQVGRIPIAFQKSVAPRAAFKLRDVGDQSLIENPSNTLSSGLQHHAEP